MRKIFLLITSLFLLTFLGTAASAQKTILQTDFWDKMKKKIILGLTVMGAILAGGWWFWNSGGFLPKSICDTDFRYCEKDSDCICLEDGCFFGNKNYYKKCFEHKETRCINFCTGAGQKPVKCFNNQCMNFYSDPIEGPVIISVDKPEYKYGEDIFITIKNIGSESVFYNKDWMRLGIEEKVRKKIWWEKWEVAFPKTRVEPPFEFLKVELKPNTTLEAKISTTDFGEAISFRALFFYTIVPEIDLEYWLRAYRAAYSHEFIIKQK